MMLRSETHARSMMRKPMQRNSQAMPPPEFREEEEMSSSEWTSWSGRSVKPCRSSATSYGRCKTRWTICGDALRCARRALSSMAVPVQVAGELVAAAFGHLYSPPAHVRGPSPPSGSPAAGQMSPLVGGGAPSAAFLLGGSPLASASTDIAGRSPKSGFGRFDRFSPTPWPAPPPSALRRGFGGNSVGLGSTDWG